jgi:hypothetical protein
MGAFLVVYGTLLTYKSSAFLWFHDSFVDRSQWNRNAEWRRNVDRLEFKMLGVCFLLIGLFVAFMSVTRLLQET